MIGPLPMGAASTRSAVPRRPKMTALEATATRRRTHYGPHVKLVRGDDALENVGADALLLLRRHGGELIVAEGRHVTAFALVETDDGVDAVVEWCIELAHKADAIADIGEDVLVACTDQGCTVLGLANKSGVREIVRVPGCLVALAASR